jgi:copper chaperone CopZ
VHQQGCDHEPTSRRDHLDCFTAVSDDSFLLSHRDVRGGKSHQHDFLVENDSQGKSGDDYDHLSDLFLSQCPQNSSTDNIGGIGNRSCADIKAKPSLLPNVSQHFLDMSYVDRPSNLQEKQVMMAIDNHGIDAIKLQKTIIDVLGICCPAEAPLIKSILKPVPGVHEVSVNVAMKTVTVHHDPITVPPVRLGFSPLFFLLFKMFIDDYIVEINHQNKNP